MIKIEGEYQIPGQSCLVNPTLMYLTKSVVTGGYIAYLN